MPMIMPHSPASTDRRNCPFAVDCMDLQDSPRRAPVLACMQYTHQGMQHLFMETAGMRDGYIDVYHPFIEIDRGCTCAVIHPF